MSEYQERTKSSLTDALVSKVSTGSYGFYNSYQGNTYTDSSTVFSRGNRYQALGKSNSGDIGGRFSVNGTKTEVWGAVDYLSDQPDRMGEFYRLKGFLPATIFNVIPPDFPVGTTRDSLFQDNILNGATAIARSSPVVSQAGVAVTLGELRRDGLPHIVGSDVLKSRCRDYKAAGSEYLNVEFGWKPFVNDLKKFSRSARDSSRLMERYYAEAGKPVHRQYKFPDLTTTLNEVVYPKGHDYSKIFIAGDTGGWQIFNGDWYAVGYERDYYLESTWFEGEFIYPYVPQDSSQASRLQRYITEADYLYGANLDPDTLWDLAPWTWAADWFSDIGDGVSNISSFLFDGLVMNYGYLMNQREFVTERSRDSFNIAGVSSCGIRRSRFWKTRIQADPFGFGVGWETLSTRQLAILAALGITKSGRK